MRASFTARARWEYWFSEIAALIIVIGYTFWFIYLSFSNGKIDFLSIFFWMAVLSLIALPGMIMNWLPVRKSILITEKGLLISFVYKKEVTFIRFSEIIGFTSHRTSTETVKYPARIRDSFKIVLSDGKEFKFDRSEFDSYAKLKAVVFQEWKNRE